MLAGVRQTHFENNGLSQGQGVSNESVQATLAEITCPPLKGEPLAVSLEADCDPRLEHMSGEIRPAGFRFSSEEGVVTIGSADLPPIAADRRDLHTEFAQPC